MTGAAALSRLAGEAPTSAENGVYVSYAPREYSTEQHGQKARASLRCKFPILKLVVEVEFTDSKTNLFDAEEVGACTGGTQMRVNGSGSRFGRSPALE